MTVRDRPFQTVAVVVVVLLAAAVATYALIAREARRSEAARQAEVAAKGRQVMPFDLDRTTHRFAKSGSGGTQTVVSDDPADSRQIELIREHLTVEAAAFRRGDYGDPASIHGAEMPGLRDLERGPARIGIRCADTPSGATITFTTSDPGLVSALHAWMDAQVSDHGGHAEHGDGAEHG